jgi:hypothetical protein
VEQIPEGSKRVGNVYYDEKTGSYYILEEWFYYGPGTAPWSICLYIHLSSDLLIYLSTQTGSLTVLNKNYETFVMKIMKNLLLIAKNIISAKKQIIADYL